jgi:hypothetical protein
LVAGVIDLLGEQSPGGLCPVVSVIAVYSANDVVAEAAAARITGHLPAGVPVVQVRYGGERDTPVFRVLPAGEWLVPDLAGGAAVALLAGGLNLDQPIGELVAQRWEHDEDLAGVVARWAGPNKWVDATTVPARALALPGLWDALIVPGQLLPARRVGELVAVCHYRDSVWLRDALMGRVAADYATVADHLARAVRSAPRGKKAGIGSVAAYAAGHQARDSSLTPRPLPMTPAMA